MGSPRNHDLRPTRHPQRIKAASLQIIRKISGFNKPSKANEQAFADATLLLNTLETNGSPKNREEEPPASKPKAQTLY